MVGGGPSVLAEKSFLFWTGLVRNCPVTCDRPEQPSGLDRRLRMQSTLPSPSSILPSVIDLNSMDVRQRRLTSLQSMPAGRTPENCLYICADAETGL